MSDLVLPATSSFEEYDIIFYDIIFNVSYWYYWLALNEKAILPFLKQKVIWRLPVN